jgi:hypothetical protein
MKKVEALRVNDQLKVNALLKELKIEAHFTVSYAYLKFKDKTSLNTH